MKKIEVKRNLLDKIIESVAPVYGAKRYRAKFAVSMAEAWKGASHTRRSLSDWFVTGGDSDSDDLPYLEDMRERSRDLSRNNPIACGAIKTKVTYVVGTGLTLQARVDRDVLGLSEEKADALERKIEAEWKLWSESKDCDISRTSTFTDLQELAFRSTLINGDVFALTPAKQVKGNPYKLKVQLIEGDRVCNPNNKPDSERLAGGIQKDSAGAPIAYHFLKGHPGNKYSSTGEWKSVPAFGSKTGRRNVLHLYHKIRIGQTRGIPDLAPVIEELKQLGRYTEAEVMAAVISSFLTVFIKTEDGGGLDPMEPTSEIGGTSTDKDFKLGQGAILELGPGEDISTVTPGRPNQAFDAFFTAVMRQIGAALEIPVEILIKHFTASYSASRAAMLEMWRFVVGRRKWLADNFCRPIYETFFTEAVATGRINAPGFINGDPRIRAAYLGSDWIGPPRGHIDPTKENNADGYAEDRGWKTAAQNTAERGGDWDRNVRQRKREIGQKKDAGLSVQVQEIEETVEPQK